MDCSGTTRSENWLIYAASYANISRGVVEVGVKAVLRRKLIKSFVPKFKKVKSRVILGCVTVQL